ncbi:RNA polymerase sigma-70 factor (ECF subfamily) [Archangium gephyra]|uniref:RNA polymerase sigma-54 factor RpoN n=1 Tax=Archangium gephyra TaxID=48 RepID=A0AAC8Q1P9_9BACT|nr:RNA polymerase sigma factor [Archangium gephyra]AKI99245.1 RNA polymerase sigma-54 factor RpoN [Archangium gephyra]REG31150.1 RNA polymerase sigma-70 factor (ECF subfamily) [Archangium gephyra]
MFVTHLSTERSFRELARTLDPILYKVALRACRDPAVARDLVQDTFERGLRSLPQLPPDTQMRAWLTTVLHNRIVDHCRVQARRQSEPLEAAEEIAQPPVDDEAWAHITPEDLERALARLPEKFQSVCQLFLIERLSYDAIARRLGIPKNTVGTRLTRGREKLRALLLGGTEEEVE